QNQQTRHRQHQFGMKAEPPGAAVLHQFEEHDKPEASEKHQGKDDEIDHRVRRIQGQAAELPLIPEQVESRVVEGGYRMKNAVIDSLSPPPFRNPPQSEEEASDSFDHRRDDEHIQDQPDDPLQVQL